MKSPIAGVESVYFKTKIEQHHPWVHYSRGLLNLEKTAEFTLRDGSGEIAVEGTPPRFATTRNAVGYEFGNGEPPPAGISAEARKMFKENRFPAPNDKRFPEGRIAASRGWFRLREGYIPSGENVTLIAEVNKGRAKPLILTDGEYYLVENLLMGELVGYSFAAFFAFALVFAFTLMLYYG